jgi:Leucine-rich repeat (LRR) protein
MTLISEIMLLVFTLLLSHGVVSSSLNICPQDCYCDLDPSGRYYTECNQPRMEEFEPKKFDEKMEVIIVRDPKHTLTIGPLFSRFKKLETLRITGANIPAIGLRSFWGVSSLRTLDLSSNNITLVMSENFFGQPNLVELNLANNFMERITSGTFSYLTVSRKTDFFKTHFN